MDYREAGVNIDEGYRAVSRYRELAKIANGGAGGAALGGIGGFAGMFSLKEALRTGEGAAYASAARTPAAYSPMEEPVLVAGTDGVGTKLDIAFRMKKYDTVGIDCVAMCVNDVLCHGARPLFFLDYIACGKLDADIAADLVKGAAAGCRETGSVLLGGETAEMPGFYDEGIYDMAGFALGIVDRKKIIDGGGIRAGDVLVGIASSGPHSNGFSLIRKVIPDLDEDFGGAPIGRVLLEPTRLYVKPILDLMEHVEIKGMAHITGGGFYENIPRMFPRSPAAPSDGAGSVSGAVSNAVSDAVFDAVIREPAFEAGGAWTVPPVFARIAAGAAGGPERGAAAQKAGAELLRTDSSLRKLMFNTFNMGIGFVIAVAPEDGGRAAARLEDRGVPAWEIGRVEAAAEGAGKVRFVRE
ncbi:MAG: phosphoribosylformylglycinamidine cyclo-ligase [Treponema sp.]|jgi:phosphoribosylformylglycinamidine cyclo-ligase|nr:phosphoribosylformylglycinamidine cyclo-ligase [Treponema sp.]